MTGYGFDFAEQLSRFRFKDGDSIVRSCKGAHSLQRVKQVHHHEFDLLFTLLSQDVSTSIAIDALQAGKHLLPEHLLVSIRVLTRCPPSPYTCNHLIRPPLMRSSI